MKQTFKEYLIEKIIKPKKLKSRNFVVKNAGINRASTHIDKKKELKRGGKVKHKGQSSY